MTKKPKQPIAPEWPDLFATGMNDALAGKEPIVREYLYWDGYAYGLTLLEKEQKKKEIGRDPKFVDNY